MHILVAAIRKVMVTLEGTQYHSIVSSSLAQRHNTALTQSCYSIAY